MIISFVFSFKLQRLANSHLGKIPLAGWRANPRQVENRSAKVSLTLSLFVILYPVSMHVAVFNASLVIDDVLYTYGNYSVNTHTGLFSHNMSLKS